MDTPEALSRAPPPEPHWLSNWRARPISSNQALSLFDGLPEGEITADFYGFLTTEPKAEVGAVHPKAMPAILTEVSEWETWLTAPWTEAKASGSTTIGATTSAS